MSTSGKPSKFQLKGNTSDWLWTHFIDIGQTLTESSWNHRWASDCVANKHQYKRRVSRIVICVDELRFDIYLHWVIFSRGVCCSSLDVTLATSWFSRFGNDRFDSKTLSCWYTVLFFRGSTIASTTRKRLEIKLSYVVSSPPLHGSSKDSTEY